LTYDVSKESTELIAATDPQARINSRYWLAAYIMALHVLVAIATGSEEIETLTPVDILRRAGATVTLAAVGANLEVSMSRGVKVRADDLLANVANTNFDLIVVPGGQPGANNMRDDATLVAMLRRQKAEGRWVSAICASPAVVLKTHGILEHEPATCYPGMESALENKSQVDSRVVVSGHVITSRGPGTAMEFSLALVRALYGADKEQQVGRQLVAQGY
jgi:4-methyl-5(b-hydroxyethyl)-thiazole monophosphate biosynthesis